MVDLLGGGGGEQKRAPRHKLLVESRGTFPWKIVKYRHRHMGEGGVQLLQILENLDFFRSENKLGQSQFLKTFPCSFYCYFEEINIFYFNLKWMYNNPVTFIQD